METVICNMQEAYYFNEGGRQSDVLAKTLKEVAKSWQGVSLKIRALIYDQGTANGTSINKYKVVLLKNIYSQEVLGGTRPGSTVNGSF